MKTLRFGVFILAGLAPLVFGCSTTMLVKSEPNLNGTVIDGNDNDWTDSTVYLPDNQISLGIRNDSANFYLMFKATTRQQVFQILGTGFTVWFDPAGGSDKKFGIHFPLSRNERSDPGLPFESDQDQTPVQRMQTELEIFANGEKEAPMRISTIDAKGIQVYVKRYDASLVYELEIPLHPSAEHPYAIGAHGARIGVGFETGKFERPSRTAGGESGEGFGEGRSGRAGMRGAGGGRGRPGGRTSVEPPKPIDLWLAVDLVP